MITRLFERSLVASRWLLAPFFLGLALGLVALLIKAAQHIVHMATTLLSASETDVILSTLGLVDLTLAASLVLIIMFSGYENFIERLSDDDSAHWPVWLARIDFTGMKLKLIASIVSIVAVELLRDLMAVHDRSDRDLFWEAGLLLVFVVSGLLLALTDRLASHSGDPTTH